MARKYVLGPNAAREFKRLIRGSGEVSRRQNLASAFAFDSEFVFPFTVQWAQSAAEGEGSWIIWLPGDDIVSVDGAAYDPTDGLEEVGGDYPEGWYLLDGDALDPDEGGKLYLNMTGGTSHTCEFSASAQTGVEDSHSVAICEASVDAETGARSVKQFVTSSIIIASGDDNEDRKYFADESSLSLVGQESSDPTQNFTSNHFHLRGFGKFSAGGYTQPIGTFQQSTKFKIGTSAKSGSAFVVRTGDVDTPNGNAIGYVRPYVDVDEIASELDVDKRPSAFEYVETKDDQGQVVSRAIVRNVFKFDGEIVELNDYAIPSGGSTGTVYLRGRQPAPTSQDADPDWTWTIGDAELEPQSGGRALNFPLYDWADGKVSCDYRTTFLSITNPYTKAKLEIKKPGSGGGIVLDSSGNVPKLTITDGNGKSVTIDLADIPGTGECPSQSIGIHELMFESEDLPEGDYNVHHILGCSDIDLRNIRMKGKTIEDVDVEAKDTETIVTFIYTDETTTEIHIPHGLRGKKGDKGDDGDTPEIWGVKNGQVTTVYADGEVIATINDGHTPQITAEKKDGVTTIYVDGNAVAQIQDGGVGQYDSITCISGIKFEISGGKLKAIISKQTFNVPDTFEMHPVEEVDAQTIDVCDVSELDVVTEEAYSTSSHQFTNKRKRVKVIGTATDATGQTPFTATPLSGE